jgi:hypothetical protein
LLETLLNSAQTTAEYYETAFSELTIVRTTWYSVCQAKEKAIIVVGIVLGKALALVKFDPIKK